MVNKLAVVIPLYNNLSYTRDTIKTLVETSGSSLDIILVDDGSTDGTDWYCKRLAEDNKNYHYIKNETNKGVNATWNIGLRKAMELRNEYICISNNDMLYVSNWDLPLIDALNKGYGVVSPYSTERELPADFPNGSTRHVNPNPLDIIGCCFMFKRELIEAIGYFPEAMLHYYGDNWIVDIVKHNGMKAGCIYESYVHHLYCKTTGSIPEYVIQKDALEYQLYMRNNDLKKDFSTLLSINETIVEQPTPEYKFGVKKENHITHINIPPIAEKEEPKHNMTVRYELYIVDTSNHHLLYPLNRKIFGNIGSLCKYMHLLDRETYFYNTEEEAENALSKEIINKFDSGVKFLIQKTYQQ